MTSSMSSISSSLFKTSTSSISSSVPSSSPSPLPSLSSLSSIPSLRLLLLGDSFVGKSKFIENYRRLYCESEISHHQGVSPSSSSSEYSIDIESGRKSSPSSLSSPSPSYLPTIGLSSDVLFLTLSPTTGVFCELFEAGGFPKYIPTVHSLVSEGCEWDGAVIFMSATEGEMEMGRNIKKFVLLIKEIQENNTNRNQNNFYRNHSYGAEKSKGKGIPFAIVVTKCDLMENQTPSSSSLSFFSFLFPSSWKSSTSSSSSSSSSPSTSPPPFSFSSLRSSLRHFEAPVMLISNFNFSSPSVTASSTSHSVTQKNKQIFNENQDHENAFVDDGPLDYSAEWKKISQFIETLAKMKMSNHSK